VRDGSFLDSQSWKFDPGLGFEVHLDQEDSKIWKVY
jgi:hypothetical protein